MKPRNISANKEANKSLHGLFKWTLSALSAVFTSGFVFVLHTNANF